MDAKFKAYKDYNFRGNQDWQKYLDALYPTPTMKQLEKRRRKWYRDHIDKDFDPEFEPGEEQKQNNNANQQRNNAGPPPGANPYAYAYQQYVYEAFPQYKVYVAALYLAFVFTLPFTGISNKIALAACVLGIVQKHGIPKFSFEYVKQVAPGDHFQNLSYWGVTFILSGSNFVISVPLAIYAYLLAGESLMGYAPQSIKAYLQKGVDKKSEFLSMKADLELYIGIYLIVGVFLGWSSLIAVFVYWQFIRIKYVLNQYTQIAFAKFKTLVDGYAYSQRTPGILRTIWEKIKSWSNNLVTMDQQPNQGGSMCSLF